MDPIKFGWHFIATGDADPSYFLFRALALRDRSLANQFVLCHLLFYHAGVDSIICTAPGEFWDKVRLHAAQPASLRGRERRHFRGAFAVETINKLRTMFPDPGTFIDALAEDTSAATCRRAQALPGFGPYFGVKVGDIAERCFYPGLMEPFGSEMVTGNPTPRAGLTLFADHNRMSGPALLEHVYRTLSVLPAPPGWDRPVSWPEIETVFCTAVEAWERRTYYVGWDIAKHRKLLTQVGDPLGLLGSLPPMPPQEIQDAYLFDREPQWLQS